MKELSLKTMDVNGVKLVLRSKNLLVIWKTSPRGSVSQFGDVNVNPLSVPASSGNALIIFESVTQKCKLVLLVLIAMF